MNEEEFKKGEFEGQFGPQFKQLPTSPKTVEEYEEKANPDLKAYNRRIVKDDYYKLMKSALIGLGIFCGILLYLLYGGYMTDEIEIPDCICNFSCPDIPENVPCPACPACPNQECSPIMSCEFPGEIDINLNESTG